MLFSSFRAIFRYTPLLFSLPIITMAASNTGTLPLDCSVIPAQTDQLCVAVTGSTSGPYDDVVIYRKKADGSLFLLGSHQGGVGTFNGFGFSDGGRFMWESWAEEGHPYFLFYRTDHYLSEGKNTKSLNVLNEYYLEYFHQFTDTGKVAYALREDAFGKCPETGDYPASVFNKQTKTKHCLKYLFLKSRK